MSHNNSFKTLHLCLNDDNLIVYKTKTRRGNSISRGSKSGALAHVGGAQSERAVGVGCPHP